jgi:hypothetical protein
MGGAVGGRQLPSMGAPVQFDSPHEGLYDRFPVIDHRPFAGKLEHPAQDASCYKTGNKIFLNWDLSGTGHARWE